MTSTYDHRIIQGAESGRFLGSSSRSSSRASTGSTTGSSRSWASRRRTAGDVLRRPRPRPRRARRPSRRPPAEVDEELLQAVQAATSLLKAHRTHGHLAARLDPLGTEPEGDPALDPSRWA